MVKNVLGLGALKQCKVSLERLQQGWRKQYTTTIVLVLPNLNIAWCMSFYLCISDYIIGETQMWEIRELSKILNICCC